MSLSSIHSKIAAGLALCGGLWTVPAHAAPAALKPADMEFFEKKIRPVLVAECYECHNAKKQKGGLRLDYKDALLRGGDTGPAVVPGDPKKSLLIQSITQEHDDLKMPKNGAKLDDSIIESFVEWVNRGAPDPRDQIPTDTGTVAVSWDQTMAVRKLWWSFQPVKKSEPPTVSDPGWSKHPVDRFLFDKMHAVGLTPGAPADRQTLIRRVTFALTGLPPTPAEIAAFEADTAPDAYPKLVDRLLASPRFGERWARHWMDLVRFAESHGSEGDADLPDAWRYRDYLIRAFNADVPYDQLIRENIAGDLLPQPRVNAAEGLNESIIGPAQLRMVEHGFQPVDTQDEQIRSVDNQIDVISKAFLGLTVSCARCHDHKFDAIAQTDFYALYGILASSRPAQVTVDTPERLNQHRAELAQLKEKLKAKLAAAWLNAAERLPKQLQETEQVIARHRELEQRTRELSTQLSALTFQARFFSDHAKAATNALPVPSSWWTFETDARDLVGPLNGTLEGGAKIEHGRLILNGTDAYLRTAPLTEPLREKTLEAWVTLGSLNQGGGGVISVETTDGAVFDSLVFAERQRGKWMAGSNNGRRTRDVEAPAESAKPEELIHLAVVYSADHRITLYRNGRLYGASYLPEGEEATLREFAAGESHVLLGRRHTGGGRAYLQAEIEEARLYPRALSAAEIAETFQAGPYHGTALPSARALTNEEQARQQQLTRDLEKARAELAALEQQHGVWLKALNEARTDATHPLHPWSLLKAEPAKTFTSAWQKLQQQQADTLAEQTAFNQTNFRPAWNLTAGDDAKWFRNGEGLTAQASRPGEFSIEPSGDLVLSGLLPAGEYTHLLSQRHNGLFTSPRFQVDSDYISVRALGGKGAMVRLIVDNYPLGLNNIFPKATLDQSRPGWLRLDTAYRRGSWAYLEFGTYEDLTRQTPPAKRPDAYADGRSWFGAQAIVFHDGKDAPKEIDRSLDVLWNAPAPSSSRKLAEQYATSLTTAIHAWQHGQVTESQRAFLDAFLRHDLLPRRLAELPDAAPLIAEYRRIEDAVPVPRRAPGVIEAIAYNQPLLRRGDPRQAGDPVPRRFLEAIDAKPYATTQSGRLELARDITDPTNPLTARVAANRIWLHLFGRGIVPTADNFGRLGAKPTHPELLDYLATHFADDGWSVKRMIRFLVLSQAYQMSSAPSDAALAQDPANQLLSHMRVQRLEAEAIRDSMLAVATRLDNSMYGPGESAFAAPGEQRRRSVYQTIRRNSLSPFLSLFDEPKPFTTQGQRDATNVPSQSLAFLNDPFVIEMARSWSAAELNAHPDLPREARVRMMFKEALGRPATVGELAASLRYLDDLAQQPGNTTAHVWQDFAQSLFNLKEFIYVK